jgi:hypothetical protein
MKTYSGRLSSLFSLLVLGVLLTASSLFAADPQPDPEARLKEARVFVEQGNQEEALQAFIWCYDHGAEVNPKFARTRDTRVTLFMFSLGKKYPPARAALVERRDALAQKVKAAPKDASEAVLTQLGYLDRVVGDDSTIMETLALFPKGKTSYKAYGSVVLEKLIEKQHYKEALAADINSDVELEKLVGQIEGLRRKGAMTPEAEAKLEKGLLKGLPCIEMYAGAGDLARARWAAELVVSMADTPEMRKQLAERLRRAGAAELAAKYEAPKK